MATLLILVALMAIHQTPSSGLEITINLTDTQNFHLLPRFWTNTGFCPMGAITNDEISNFLLSDDVNTNLQFLGALPNRAIEKVRIHWLLELVNFIKLNHGRVPVYDFSKMDQFLDRMVEANLDVGFEFMGNPNNLFNLRNLSRGVLFEDLVFSIGRRYRFRYGPKIVKRWQFETWNEPDLKTYNILNFTISDYIDHLIMIRRGLDAVGRTANNTHFELSGPAGLFKNISHHELCWGALKYCNEKKKCPFDRITFHRKGDGIGGARKIVNDGLALIRSIHKQFPKLVNFSLSNNEADPISGWSTPRSFQSDVRYAAILVDIILRHWRAKITTEEFRHLDSISHDNAFLSYHPYEFDQRTLLARFQMNLTQPPHTQFIQKPVYTTMGLLSNLAEYADNIERIAESNFTYFATTGHTNYTEYANSTWYGAILLLANDEKGRIEVNLTILLPNPDVTFAYIIETVEAGITDPVKIWQFYGSPSYPNATVRKLMRDRQGPNILTSAIVKSVDNMNSMLAMNFSLSLKKPSIALLRICGFQKDLPRKPLNLKVQKVNPCEVLLFWKESYQAKRCIKMYEVYFREASQWEWKLISEGRHVPFLSFHFQPQDGKIQGDYKVRAVDLSGRYGPFSEVKGC